MALDPERIPVNNDLLRVKEWLPACLQEPVLFKSVKQIRVSWAKLKVTSLVEKFHPSLHCFDSLDNYTVNLVQQLTDLITDNTNFPHDN